MKNENIYREKEEAAAGDLEGATDDPRTLKAEGLTLQAWNEDCLPRNVGKARYVHTYTPT